MRILTCASLLVLLSCSVSVQARSIATDIGDPANGVDPKSEESPGCASDFGGTCSAFNLGFKANFGAGRTDQIYIYDDGQITFGTPAAGGGAIFGPGSVAGSLGPPRLATYIARTVYFDQIGGAFNVQWRTCNEKGSSSTGCFKGAEVDLHIVPNYAAKTVGITLDTSKYTDPYESLGASFGYSLGSQIKAPALLDGNSAFSLSVPFGVPEPATWGLLIAGFAATGFAQRRRRGLAAAG